VTYKLSFAEEVKYLHNHLGLSQKALDEALGVSFATINHWEVGHTEPHKLVRKYFEAYKAKIKKLGQSDDPASM
jgi:DNA-binding transcriptional regulator YiaG